MKRGLLWFDDDPGRDLEQKVAQAAYRYHQKFGIVPDTCYVHPDAAEKNDRGQICGVQILALPTVLKHHLWIGLKQSDERSY